MYLVDTNVISAGAPSRSAAAADVVRWMDEHSADLYLSAVTVTEVEDGIAKLRREKAKRKAAELTAWLETLLRLYGNRFLAFADIVIEATARCHGLTILTRNTRHFEPLELPTVNPFEQLPSGN